MAREKIIRKRRKEGEDTRPEDLWFFQMVTKEVFALKDIIVERHGGRKDKLRRPGEVEFFQMATKEVLALEENMIEQREKKGRRKSKTWGLHFLRVLPKKRRQAERVKRVGSPACNLLETLSGWKR
jgi:hypothetical protein